MPMEYVHLYRFFAPAAPLVSANRPTVGRPFEADGGLRRMRQPCKGVRYAQTGWLHAHRGHGRRRDRRDPRGGRVPELWRLRAPGQDRRGGRHARRHAGEAGAILSRQPHVRRRGRRQHALQRRRHRRGQEELHLCLRARCRDLHRDRDRRRHRRHDRLHVHDRQHEPPADDGGTLRLRRGDDAGELLAHEKGRDMLTARPSRGFTLIELMIGVALLAVLLMLAMPTFSTMLHNRKLRGVAESIQAGLQIARIEAMKRNQTVEFMLTDDDPVEAGVSGFTATTTGPNWAVRVDTGAGFAFVEGRAAPEGSNATATTVSVQIAATYPAGASTIRFDGLGRGSNLGTTNGLFDISNPAGGACKTTAGSEPMRCLRVVVTPGGRVRMCDPSVPTTAGDTRAC